MAAVAERSIRVTIAKDGVRAHLVTAHVDPSLVTQQQILAALDELGIPVSEAVMGRIKQIDQAARAGELPTEPILLVEGREPVEGSGACFELSPELVEPHPAGDGCEEHRTDYHRSQIVTVSPGTVVGTWKPQSPPVAGADVYGKPIQLSKPPKSLQLGQNLELAADGRSVVATAPGKLHITRYQVTVLPVVDIEGDVDFTTGNVDAPSDVLISGTIRDSFQVKSAASIAVRGAIEAAEVRAGTDLQVNGGIAGRGQGRVLAGGELFTKFCNEACVEAAGDLTITREAMNSQIRTGGKLLIPRGKLIGGRAYARLGVEVCQLGNEANLKTEVAVGVDPLAMIEAHRTDEQIKKKLEAIARIRQNIQPLMAQLKRLTPLQRERATELLCQAEAMEQEIREQERKKAESLQQPTADDREVSLVVQKIAYPGVSIIFGDRLAMLHKERKGPFKIVRRAHNRVEEILLIDKISGSITTLNSREYHPSSG